MSKCYDCRKEVADNVFRCNDCLKNRKESKFRKTRPMTKWEEMKLGWIKDERKWIENIRQRDVIYEKGKPITVLRDNNGNIKDRMPSPRDRY